MTMSPVPTISCPRTETGSYSSEESKDIPAKGNTALLFCVSVCDTVSCPRRDPVRQREGRVKVADGPLLASSVWTVCVLTK